MPSSLPIAVARSVFCNSMSILLGVYGCRGGSAIFTIRENVVPVFLSRISNADIQCVAIANPDELWNCSRVFPAQLPIWKTENDRLVQVI